MARILLASEWYELVSSDAMYEDDYERLLLANAPSLFPSYVAVPFKGKVYSDNDAARPDFALVHKQYRDWYVVEAEMAHHPFSGHVRPQIETLSRAYYGEETAIRIAERSKVLDRDRMISVTKGHQPQVLVVVNANVPTWARDLKHLGALVATVEVYRSMTNRYALRLDGECPEEGGALECTCVVELARFLKVSSPGILPIPHGQRMLISFRGGVGEWTRTDLSNCVYLSSSAPVSLNARSRYLLTSRPDAPWALSEIS